MFFGSAMVDHTSEKLKHVAFSVIIAVAVLTALGSVIISSVSTEGFEINEVTLKKGSGTDAVLLVSIKNLGNSQISDISVTIDGLNLPERYNTIPIIYYNCCRSRCSWNYYWSQWS